MKSLDSLLLVMLAIVFCLSITSVYGQYVPVPSTINTPYGNVHTTTYQYMPMYYGSGSMSVKHEFKILLKNDSLITVKSKIHIEDSIHFIKYKVKGQQHVIRPTDTKEIYRYSSDKNKKITGIPTDSCWLFKAKEGKINSYSYVAEEVLSYAVAIQAGDDGEIVPLTEDNLLHMIGNADDKLLQLIKKHKFNKAIELFNKRAREGDLSTNK